MPVPAAADKRRQPRHLLPEEILQRGLLPAESSPVLLRPPQGKFAVLVGQGLCDDPGRGVQLIVYQVLRQLRALHESRGSPRTTRAQEIISDEQTDALGVVRVRIGEVVKARAYAAHVLTLVPPHLFHLALQASELPEDGGNVLRGRRRCRPPSLFRRLGDLSRGRENASEFLLHSLVMRATQHAQLFGGDADEGVVENGHQASLQPSLGVSHPKLPYEDLTGGTDKERAPYELEILLVSRFARPGRTLHRLPHPRLMSGSPEEYRRSVTWSERLEVEPPHSPSRMRSPKRISDEAAIVEWDGEAHAEQRAESHREPKSFLGGCLSCFGREARVGPEASLGRVTIHRPIDDDDVVGLLNYAKEEGLEVRVMGTGSSQAPCVLGSNEHKRALVISLESYAERTRENMFVDRQRARVWVNAGWTLDRFLNRLHASHPTYVLPALPPRPFATVGSLVAGNLIGSCVSAGFSSEAAVAVRVLDLNGRVHIVDTEEDMKLFRGSWGLLGVITHVELQFQRLQASRLASHLFDLDHAASRIDLVRTVLLPDLEFQDDEVLHWQEYYFNPYNWRICRLDRSFSAYGVPKSPLHTRQERSSLSIEGMPPRLVVCEILDPTLRKKTPILDAKTRRGPGGASAAIDAVVAELRRAADDSAFSAQDLLVLRRPPECPSMSYFIPVDKSKKNVLAALEAVHDVATRLESQGAAFKFDLPVELRFVASDGGGSVLSPIGSATFAGAPASGDQDQASGPEPTVTTGALGPLYLAIDVPALGDRNIDVTLRSQSTPIMQDMLAAYAELEKRLVQISPAVTPVPTSLFGLVSSSGTFEAFSAAACGKLYTDEQKKRFSKSLHQLDPAGLFHRAWASKLGFRQ